MHDWYKTARVGSKFAPGSCLLAAYAYLIRLYRDNWITCGARSSKLGSRQEYIVMTVSVCFPSWICTCAMKIFGMLGGVTCLIVWLVSPSLVSYTVHAREARPGIAYAS